MKKTIKFLLKTASVLFLILGLIPLLITTISSFFYFVCEEIKNSADLKVEEYDE